MDIMKTGIRCRPISGRFMTVRLRESPFNTTIVQVYAIISSHDDTEVDEFYCEFLSLVDRPSKQDTLVL